MRRTTILGAVTAALLAVTAAAPSYAGWSRPFGISDATHTNTTPVVVTAPTGRAVVAWTRHERSYTPESSVVMFRARTQRGAWQARQRLSPPAQLASFGDLAVDDSGAAVVVWSSTSHRARSGVFLRRVTPAGDTGPVLRVSTVKHDAGYAPTVALAGDGSGWVAWTQTRQGRYVPMARRVLADGTLGPAVTLDAETASDGPVLALDRSGEGALVWAAGTVLRGARLEAATGPGTARTLARAQGKGTVQQVQTGVDAGGTVTVTWISANAYGLGPVRGTRWTAAGDVSPRLVLTPRAQPASTYLLRAADAGKAQLTWTAGRGGAVLRTRRLGIGLRRAPVHVLTRHVGRYAVTVRGDGSGLLVYVTLRGLRRGQATYRRITGPGQLAPARRMTGLNGESLAPLPGRRYVAVGSGRAGPFSSRVYGRVLR